MTDVVKDASRALAMLSDDTSNLELQKQHFVGSRAYAYLTPETNKLVLQCTGLIAAFFSNEANGKFRDAINSVKLTNSEDNDLPKYQMSMSLDDLGDVTKRLAADLRIFFVIKKLFHENVPRFKSSRKDI